MDLAAHIRNIPDFPKKGIQFKDISPLLASVEAFREAMHRMADPFRQSDVTRVAGIESRGFLFAAGVALELDAGLVMIRKPGKLPAATLQASYELEYGQDVIEVQRDAINDVDRVVLVDDLLATGGTLEAAIDLVGKTGAELVGISVLIELEGLGGRQRLGGASYFTQLVL
jgi:adenine phosphoribosyltransferase